MSVLGTAEGFEELATGALESILSRRPELASSLGDHRFDDRLMDQRPEALEDDRRAWRQWLEAVRAIDVASLSTDQAVDAAILCNRLDHFLLDLEDLREYEWNPLVSNPGDAIYGLLAREYAPMEARLKALAGRLAAVPERLAVARRALGLMPRVHVETALVQFAGTLSLVTTELDRALLQAPGSSALISTVRPAAVAALEEHLRWLTDQLPKADGDARIGPELFARKLALTLDTLTRPEEVRRRAESDLDRIEEELARTASHFGGSVAEVFDRLAADRPDNSTIVAAAEQALSEATRSVEDYDLVTVLPDPLEIIVMPEVRRGIAVAYCDAPGALETASLPTFFAVSPTPADWAPARVESFYREYNTAMVQDLTVHEAMPGHFLQLGHSRKAGTETKVRAAFRSGPFVEGWAVYAEELMASHGYGGPAVKMQQLKMLLRSTINALLDQGVHASGMTEAEAMALMTGRGHQEQSEAAGKWRRALLTSAQLSTYFVGHTEMTDAVSAFKLAHPRAGERTVHDTVLSHGSPPPRHLRALLKLDSA
ncbi:MAG TPA: DUF885 domain-containing protein [Acidimicrobiales bacterium]|nr:DUF885 domain-containing protein [Acidimicrobiales bacterium]